MKNVLANCVLLFWQINTHTYTPSYHRSWRFHDMVRTKSYYCFVAPPRHDDVTVLTSVIRVNWELLLVVVIQICSPAPHCTALHLTRDVGRPPPTTRYVARVPQFRHRYFRKPTANNQSSQFIILRASISMHYWLWASHCRAPLLHTFHPYLKNTI